MKDLSKQFLTESDRERIIAAVKEAEKHTAGEIVPMVVSTSYHYPMANVIGAAVLALPAALILALLVGGWLWIGGDNLWLFLVFFTILFIIFHVIVKHTVWLKRLFVSQKEMDEEVEEAAVTGFYREALYRTRRATGVLIYISVFEHKVWILADRGINEKVEQSRWDDIIRKVVGRIKQKQQALGICEAVERVGKLLTTHFPVQPDDTDELRNLIVDA